LFYMVCPLVRADLALSCRLRRSAFTITAHWSRLTRKPFRSGTLASPSHLPFQNYPVVGVFTFCAHR
jgi:hypothetical protein